MSRGRFALSRTGMGASRRVGGVTNEHLSSVADYTKVTGQINRREKGYTNNSFTWKMHTDAMERRRLDDPIGWLKWKHNIVKKKNLTAKLVAYHDKVMRNHGYRSD